MKYREFLEHLQKFTNQKITQTEIAEGLGVSQSAITKRISRESDFTFNDLIRMQTHLKEKFKNLSFVQNQENENVTLDYYPDVFGSCGGGAFVLSEQKELMQSLYYGQVTKRQPACVLIMERGEKDLRYLRRLRKAAYKKGIRTFTMRPEHLINKTKTAAGK